MGDVGQGISAGDMRHVFERYWRNKPSRGGGSGLGLHIVHNIVRGVLGGRIELKSNVGEGSKFTLVLPAVAPDFAAPALEGGARSDSS